MVDRPFVTVMYVGRLPAGDAPVTERSTSGTPSSTRSTKLGRRVYTPNTSTHMTLARKILIPTWYRYPM